MGTEQAYGSSAFGIVESQWIDKRIQIPHAQEYHRPDYNEMLSLVYIQIHQILSCLIYPRLD